MQSVARRLDKLDAILNPLREPLRSKRWVLTVLGRPATLANTRCTRRLHSNGTLMEVVTLDGTCEGLADDDLERFIQSCPIRVNAKGGSNEYPATKNAAEWEPGGAIRTAMRIKL